jgi:hypothetical protein
MAIGAYYNSDTYGTYGVQLGQLREVAVAHNAPAEPGPGIVPVSDTCECLVFAPFVSDVTVMKANSDLIGPYVQDVVTSSSSYAAHAKAVAHCYSSSSQPLRLPSVTSDAGPIVVREPALP